jgi:hypothetical protein
MRYFNLTLKQSERELLTVVQVLVGLQNLFC